MHRERRVREREREPERESDVGWRRGKERFLKTASGVVVLLFCRCRIGQAGQERSTWRSCRRVVLFRSVPDDGPDFRTRSSLSEERISASAVCERDCVQSARSGFCAASSYNAQQPNDDVADGPGSTGHHWARRTTGWQDGRTVKHSRHRMGFLGRWSLVVKRGLATHDCTE